MLLAMAAYVKGKLEDLGLEITDKSPFLKVDGQKQGEKLIKMYKAFVDFIEDLDKCITDKMPDIVEDASKLPGEAEDIQQHAQD
jgi:hypothetical protein